MCRWGFQSVAACRESLEAGTREGKKGRKIVINIIVGVYLACYVGSKVVVPLKLIDNVICILFM